MDPGPRCPTLLLAQPSVAVCACLPEQGLTRGRWWQRFRDQSGELQPRRRSAVWASGHESVGSRAAPIGLLGHRIGL